MNTATPNDDITPASAERTRSVNEERARGGKSQQLSEMQSGGKSVVLENSQSAIGKEIRSAVADFKKDEKEDDSDVGEDNEVGDETIASVKKAEEPSVAKTSKRRRSKNDPDEYVPMTFPQKVRMFVQHEYRRSVIPTRRPECGESCEFCTWLNYFCGVFAL